MGLGMQRHQVQDIVSIILRLIIRKLTNPLGRKEEGTAYMGRHHDSIACRLHFVQAWGAKETASEA